MPRHLFATALLGLSLALVAWEARAAACMFDAQGNVVYRPKGADCGNLASGDARPESAYQPPVPVGDDWLPIRTGDDRIFEIDIYFASSEYGGPFEEKTFRGIQRRQLVPGPARLGAGVVESRASLRVAEDEHDFDRMALLREWLRVGPRGIELLGSNRVWLGQRRDIDYANGALLLPAQLGQGSRWPSGSIVDDDTIRLEETGRVLGTQDVVTPAGTFRKCAVVKFEGDIGSRVKRMDGRAAVMGRIVRTLWLARGVGIVREQEEWRIEWFFRGEPFTAVGRSDAMLKGVVAASAPAAPGGR